MTKKEVNMKVAEAVEHLQMAQPGRPARERHTHRQAANAIMATFTLNDLRKINDTWLQMLQTYA